ncbi:MAG: septum formation initiator family protein [Desulfobacteraceae bacterium]|nr:septum formation initiator family protein [Desulfobacteraceae bacterium]MCF8093837.1 septum formation initiator family protein [Desulfobacteraceae bacterium]
MKIVSAKSLATDFCLWAAVLAAGIYLLAIIFGDRGLMELKSMHKDLRAVQEKNARIEEENTALYRTINRLKNDPEYIEYTARRELHMVAPDEIVFKFLTGEKGNGDE